MVFNILLGIYKWGFILLGLLTAFVYSMSQNWIATGLCGGMALFFGVWYVITSALKRAWYERVVKRHN